MGDTINQRLKEYIELKKIDGPDIYGGTKISRQIYSDSINTSKSIPSEKLGIIVKKMPDDLNLRWLLTGEGEMLIKKDDTTAEPALPYKNRLTHDEKQVFEERIINLENTIAVLTKLLSEAKEGGCGQGEIEGGVAPHRKTG